MNAPCVALDYGQCLRYAFNTLDSHDRGFLGAEDFCRGLALCGKLGFFVENAHAAYTLFGDLDADASGRVDFRQFFVQFTKRARDELTATWFYLGSTCCYDPPEASFASIYCPDTPQRVFKQCSTFPRDASVIAAFDSARVIRGMTASRCSSRRGVPGRQSSKIPNRADLQDGKWSILRSLYACTSESLHSLGIYLQRSYL